jgi:hypothetical protein
MKVWLENLKRNLKMLSLTIDRFHTYRNALYKSRPKRESSRLRAKFGNKGNFDDMDDLGSVKLKILAFQGKIDLEAYLEWKKRIELIFDIHYYSKKTKVKLVIIEFIDYVMI